MLGLKTEQIVRNLYDPQFDCIIVGHAGTELILYSVTSKFLYKDLGSGEFFTSVSYIK